MSANEWLLAMVNSGTKRSTINALIDMIPDEFVSGWKGDDFCNKHEAMQFLFECRRAYWDTMKFDERGRQVQKQQPERMSAAEVNAWLRTLPPVPPYPEVCQCDLCRAARDPSTCRRCGAEMRPGIALAQTITAGAPDLGGSDVVTMSHGGPGAVIDCMKCYSCGWSVTVKGG